MDSYKGDVMDKYDEAVRFLTENPGSIERSWSSPHRTDGGCLFDYASLDRQGDRYGCLTQIKRGSMEAWDPKLTEAIRADERIPLSPRDITIESLPAFAEWQRKIDQLIGVNNND